MYEDILNMSANRYIDIWNNMSTSFLIHFSNIWICVISCVSLDSQPAGRPTDQLASHVT